MNKKNDNLVKKPMLKVSGLVDHMKLKNIKFNVVSECEAEKYLKNNNNYYNLIAYRDNFERYMINGSFINKYIDLEFAYLKDMAIIDHRLRLLLFKMIIDIEHYLKVRLLNLIEDIDLEDGYRIVNLYLENDYYDKEKPKMIHNSILKKIGNPYYKKIFLKYDKDQDSKLEDIPIWEFMEIITFGELVNFYEFFSKEYDLKKELDIIFILREIVKLRNAVAHNTCVLCDLRAKDNLSVPDYKVLQYLSNCGIKKNTRKNKLMNSRIRQITYTLFMFNNMVTSSGIKNNINIEINELFYGRIIYHKDYYNNNELLKSIYNYFSKIIKMYYKVKDD